MEKYVVKIEMRRPMSTDEAKKKYGTKADMNKDTYARGNVYSFGYTNEISMAKSFSRYSDAENYANSCMFEYWGNVSTVAKVVKCEVVMKPIEINNVQFSISQKMKLLSIYKEEFLKKNNLNIVLTKEEVKQFFNEIKNDEMCYNYWKTIYESIKYRIK